MQRRIASTQPLDWDNVRVFLVLVRTRSLAQASRALGMDKSTVSRRLSALEARLGARLFLRTREGLRVAPVGERLRAHAERMESEARALESAAVAGDGEATGLVRVATTEALAARLIQNGLLDLRRAHFGLQIELLGGNRPVDMARGEADVALRVTKPVEAQLTVRVAGKLGFALFASAEYLRTRGAPRTPAQLEGHDVIVPSGELERLPEGVWLASRPGVHVVLRSSSMSAMVAAAKGGHGLTALTRAWGDAEGLERVFSLENIPPRPVWIVTHPDSGKSAAVRVVADRVMEIVRAAAHE